MKLETNDAMNDWRGWMTNHCLWIVNAFIQLETDQNRMEYAKIFLAYPST